MTWGLETALPWERMGLPAFGLPGGAGLAVWWTRASRRIMATAVWNDDRLAYLDGRRQLADYKSLIMLSMIARPSVTVAVFEGPRSRAVEGHAGRLDVQRHHT